MLLQKKFELPENQVVLFFSERHPIVQLPANLNFRYFAKEDVPGGSPLKITIESGLNEWREYSFSIKDAKALLYFLAKVIRQRQRIAGQVSD